MTVLATLTPITRIVASGAVRKLQRVSEAGTLRETVLAETLLPGEPRNAVKGVTAYRAALRCFTRHPGELVTDDQILDAMQPDPFRPRPSKASVRKAIGRLRRDVPIVTVRKRPGGWMYEVAP